MADGAFNAYTNIERNIHDLYKEVQFGLRREAAAQ
jgi:hypothetical protein